VRIVIFGALGTNGDGLMCKLKEENEKSFLVKGKIEKEAKRKLVSLCCWFWIEKKCKVYRVKGRLVTRHRGGRKN